MTTIAITVQQEDTPPDTFKRPTRQNSASSAAAALAASATTSTTCTPTSPSTPINTNSITSPTTTPSPAGTTSKVQQFLLIVTSLVTVHALIFLARSNHHEADEQATVGYVTAYAWVTAVSTGFGVVPFLFTKQELNQQWFGAANSIAAGMMITASGTLAVEGYHAEDMDPSRMYFGMSCAQRLCMGLFLGVLFILLIKWILKGEEVGVGELQGATAARALLVMAVMTMHSFAEGVGIGVAFSRQKGGQELGTFISLSLAIHNVPEGLAVAVVLVPRGVSLLSTVVWCIFSSIPQLVVAVPVFMFVSVALPWLPVGLGFAGGAMCYVALFELLPEALENISMIKSFFIFGLSALVMAGLSKVAAGVAGVAGTGKGWMSDVVVV